MKRLMMLVAVVSTTGCGTFLNVGDNGRNRDDLISGQQCGSNVCAPGDVCCNASCGICTPPGGACTEQVCDSGSDAGPPPDAGQCAPVLCPLFCQYGFKKDAAGCEFCFCNPPPVQCGPNTCAVGEVCCNESCGICTPPDGACTQQVCAPVDAGTPTACGFNSCAPGTECCNDSCGICVPPGAGCTKQLCACSPVLCTLACQYGFKRGADGCEVCDCAPAPVSCGNVTCNAGLECCNASCGICVPPGQACTQQACN